MLPRPWFPDHGACHSAGTTISAHRSASATMFRTCTVDRALECLADKPPGALGTAIAMKATIYHNPMCGTSRKTLAILADSGADVWIHEYLKSPPTRDELKRLYERAGNH